MSHPAFVPDDPEEWAKANSAAAPAAAWQPDDPEEWAKSQGTDQNARLLGKSVNVAPTGEFFQKNMAFHREKREADPLYQSIMEKPAEGQPDHPYAQLARATVPGMLNAVDAFKSVLEHFDPKLEKSRYFAQKAMDAMAAGTYSQAGTFLQAAKLMKGDGNVRDLIHKGILSGPEVLFGVGPGKDTRTFNSEFLDEAGVKNPWLKYGGGFALDVAANPYNIMKGAGLSKLGKAAKMFTDAKNEERLFGTPLPDYEKLAKNGSREARTIVKMLKAGKEEALNLGTTTAEQVEKGHYLFPGVQIPGMKRINLAKFRYQMDEPTWANLAAEHPDIAAKIKPGEPIPKDAMKSLLEVKGDIALQGVSLHPSSWRKGFTIPVPDIHNPVWEAQGVPKGVAVPLAKAMTATNRYMREFNPELLKPGVTGAASLYGKTRKFSSDTMQNFDKLFNRYPKPVIEGKLGDPRIYDGTTAIFRMALNQKGDLTREMLDHLFALRTEAGGDNNVILRMARAGKMDKAFPDTYRALETALASRVPDEEFARVRSSLEEASRVITPNRDLPTEFELRHFGTTDELAIRQQIEEAAAVQSGEWGAVRRQAIEEAGLEPAEARAALAEIDAQEAALARDAPDKLAAADNLERNLQRHREKIVSLQHAARQAAYSGSPADAARWQQEIADLRTSLGPEGWGETYRKMFGKTVEDALPEPTGGPRMAIPSATERLKAAQAEAAQLEQSLRSVQDEQRALAGAMEASPSPSNEALVRLERANQKAAELQAQMQQRVKLIQQMEERVANEDDTNSMIQKVQAGLDKAHEAETADEIAALEKHPAMARPSTVLKSVREERARLLKEHPAAFRDESFAPEGETVGDHLKARYGDDPEYYKAMLEQRAAAHDRAEFRKAAARGEREAAKGLRGAAKTVEPAAPEPPSLAAPAWRLNGEEIITAPGKTWHDFTLHPPDIQARIEAGEGVETGFVDATGKFFTREEAAAQGLKMKAPGASSEAMLKANSATPQQNPHWWHPGYTRESRAKAFDDLPDDADVWVFTATDDATADKFLKGGVKYGEKPTTLSRERFKAGEEARFSPGSGLSDGLYVGSDPMNVDGYGRRILAIKVKKGQVSVSPEQATLGNKSPGEAISLSDATIMSDIPKENIIDTGIKRDGVTAQEFMSKAFVVEKKTVQPNRPAIGKPRVPLKGSGLPVPAPKPVASAVDLSSFGMNNPPDIRAFTANREAGGSQLALAMTGAQGLRGELPEAGTAGMAQYQSWLTGTMKNPTVAADIASEVERDLIKLTGEGWAKRRAMRDMIDAWIYTEDGRQKIVKFMAEYYPHVKDVMAAYSGPLATVLGGVPKGGLNAPGFASARKFRDTFDDINQAYKLAHGKGLLVDDVTTTLFNRAAESVHFQVHNDMLNRLLSSMGLEGSEIQAALKAEGITEVPNARAAANLINSHYWMRKMGYPEEQIKRVEELSKKLYDMGVWSSEGGPSDPHVVEGVMNRLAAIARKGDFSEAKGITFGEGGAMSDLPDGIKSRLMKAVGVTTDADLIDPKKHVPGTSLKDAAAKLIKSINQTIKDHETLSPRLKLFMTKGDLARLADYPDFVNVMSVVNGSRVSDVSDAAKSLVNLDPATIPNFKDLDKFGIRYYLVPEQLANDINGGVRTLLDDSGPKNFLVRWMHNATNVWKQSVTTVFPEFHVRNILTNLYQLHVYAGVDDPALFMQARRMQLGLKGVFVRDDDSILTHPEVMRLAQKYGIVGHGYFGEDVKAIMDPRKGGSMSRTRGVAALANPFVSIPSVGRDTGRFLEENARLGGFLHYLKKGYSPYAASMWVKRYLFDYSELSNVERNAFRLLFPFYAWMRKNIPLQVSEVLKNPATISVSRDIQHAVSGMVNGRDLTPEEMANIPKWLRPMLPILYKNRKDKQRIMAIVGKASPFSDPMAIGEQMGERGVFGGAAGYLAGALNPGIKEPIEQWGRRSIEEDRPLFTDEGKMSRLNLPAPLVGPTSAFLNALPGDAFDNTPGERMVMLPERTAHALQNLRAVSLMNATMRESEADTTAAQNLETIFKNMVGGRSYDVDLMKNYQIEGRKAKKEVESRQPIIDGRVNYDSPLVKEIRRRNRMAAEGVPPVSPEERKRFNEWMKKKIEAFQKQRAQRP